MAIHIEKDGWKVSADTVAELEAGISVVQRALQGNAAPEKRRRGRPPGRTTDGDKIAQQRAERRKQVALPFLRAMASTSTGITASGLVAALQLKNEQAIGSVAQTTNRLVKALGFAQSEVYQWRKKPGHEKTWFPRPRIQDCIKAVEGT